MKTRGRKIYIYIVLVTVFFSLFTESVKASPSVSAQRAILMDGDTGRVLYEKDAHTKSRIASITKIMTAVLAVESGKLNEMVKISDLASGTEGSSLYLKPGEKVKLEDLVYGLMLRSGNDSAVAIAEHVGGSLDGFVYLMNKKAEEIGMVNSHFENPHGLDDHENHYSSAYDMALLTKYAMELDKYREIAGTKVHTAPDPESEWDRKWKNKNRLLTELYKYSTGGKTGYTKRAKRTLVSTASKGGDDLISVTLNGPDDWNDHIQMFEYGFKHFDSTIVLPKGKLDSIENEVYKGRLTVKRDVLLSLKDDEEKDVRIEYKLMKPKKEWLEENNAPNIVGNAIIYLEEREVDRVPLYFMKNQERKERSWWTSWKRLFASTLGVKDHG
ncbi:D-alanyl-D-alanine carboxypeptidase [Bacillus pakistanensis]|uniref:serine-type D-Ala-D-Ala carboxypeptidase n=1 Tax=Rossellomorea pakistanensis TaxID=992288 RepID=A0ABS2N9G3_9BACI|nr:D-alanyl-D-alanine carboxypeptidase family protein [Bacillus pakistanensis]MBM7584404.1 D-alanyl-D-alanine carboxypeptidase [Bacillus pakistanensis]